MSDNGRPVVVALDEQTDVAIDLDRWQALATAALVSCGVRAGELNLLFVDEATMGELNQRHMGHVGPTDVLSFPLDGPGSVDAGEALIGDVVVCPGYAARQASADRRPDGHDGSMEDELALLIVHGVLHVMGHDHAEPSQARVMQLRERELLAAHHRR